MQDLLHSIRLPFRLIEWHLASARAAREGVRPSIRVNTTDTIDPLTDTFLGRGTEQCEDRAFPGTEGYLLRVQHEPEQLSGTCLQ
jgi:hypothetical protein